MIFILFLYFCIIYLHFASSKLLYRLFFFHLTFINQKIIPRIILCNKKRNQHTISGIFVLLYLKISELKRFSLDLVLLSVPTDNFYFAICRIVC